MPNYFVGVPVTYTALAQTLERPSDTFVYTWTFDDNATASGASVLKTWSTMGSHSATVTAVDNQVGTSGSATKAITVDPTPVRFAQVRYHATSTNLDTIVTSASADTSNFTTKSINYGFSFSNLVDMTLIGPFGHGAGPIVCSGDTSIQLMYIDSSMFLAVDHGLTWVEVGQFGALGNTPKGTAISRDGQWMIASGSQSLGGPPDTGYIGAATVSDPNQWLGGMLVDTPVDHIPLGPDAFYALAVSSTGLYMYGYGSTTGFVRSLNTQPRTDGTIRYGWFWTYSSTPFTGKSVHAMVCSDDGSKVLAAGQDDNVASGSDYLYLSTDFGVSFTQIVSAGKRAWGSVAMSPDGTKMAAVYPGSSGYIYLSTDSGVTWVPQTAAGLRNWYRVHVSSSGLFLVGMYFTGYDYRYLNSFDGGATWM